MQNLFFILTVLALPLTTSGQAEQQKPIRKMRVAEIYIQQAFSSGRIAKGTLSDFKSLAPKSVLLNSDLADYSSYDRIHFEDNTMFSFLLGIQFHDKQDRTYKNNPILRIGIGYLSASILNAGLYYESQSAYDTLVSAQTGQIIYLDTVTRNDLGMYYSSQQLSFDGSMIFKTNPESRWSLFTGVGITSGFSFSTNTVINHQVYNTTEIIHSNGINTSTFSSFDHEEKSETHTNKNNFSVSAYIPLGLDFRIGTKSEFWKMMHLFYEMRLGINAISIPELRTISNATLQHGFGLKVSW